MKGIKCLFLVLWVFFTVNVSAKEEIDFNVDGLRVGDKLNEEFEKSYCLKKRKIKKEIECKKKIKINEIDVMARYFFYDSSLVTISLIYDARFYNDLVKSYANKFSRRPHENIREEIYLDENEKYTNEKVLWKTHSGDFAIEKYWNNFTKGYAYLESPEYLKYRKRKENEINGGIMKKVFGDFFN